MLAVSKATLGASEWTHHHRGFYENFDENDDDEKNSVVVVYVVVLFFFFFSVVVVIKVFVAKFSSSDSSIQTHAIKGEVILAGEKLREVHTVHAFDRAEPGTLPSPVNERAVACAVS